MEPTISMILPIRNAAKRLHRDVAVLLDALAESSQRFELILIDDASDDRTDELAYDLAGRFPQIRIVRHPRPLGMSQSVQTGLTMARGQIVFVQDDQAPVNADDLRALWRLRKDPHLAIARLEPVAPKPPQVIRRLMAWGAKLKHRAGHFINAGGMQMIRMQTAMDEATNNNPAAAAGMYRVEDGEPTNRPRFLGRVSLPTA